MRGEIDPLQALGLILEHFGPKTQAMQGMIPFEQDRMQAEIDMLNQQREAESQMNPLKMEAYRNQGQAAAMDNYQNMYRMAGSDPIGLDAMKQRGFDTFGIDERELIDMEWWKQFQNAPPEVQMNMYNNVQHPAVKAMLQASGAIPQTPGMPVQ